MTMIAGLPRMTVDESGSLRLHWYRRFHSRIMEDWGASRRMEIVQHSGGPQRHIVCQWPNRMHSR